MNPPLSSHALLAAAIAVLVCWRIVRRVRRLVGRQRVRPGRLAATAVLFPTLAVAVALTSLADARLVEGLVAGVAIGVALGFLGLRLTRFEHDSGGACYTPNTLLGVAISLLFVGRIAYRLGTVYFASSRLDPATMQAFGRSPLTLVTFGVVAAYFTTFSIGVLAWHRRARATQPMTLPETPAV